jgi:pimeloyl-ACP methyl ester carboxylesterase
VTSYVLVHGAWHGAWCWERVQEHLPGAVAIDLPSNHVDGAGLTDDVAAVRAVLDGMEDVVLCGHSYGGAVITEAGAHDNVSHLVYLCAFVLDVGETVMENAAPPTPPTALTAAIRPDGDWVGIDPDGARTAFYGDCDETPVERLVPHGLAAFTTPVAVAAWKVKPSTYVLCTKDEAVHPDLQRWLATRCTGTVELDASHSPMLSVPGRVAEVLVAAGRA